MFECCQYIVNNLNQMAEGLGTTVHANRLLYFVRPSLVIIRSPKMVMM